VKHHRPDLALVLLTHVRAEKERMSLGSCLAAIWSRLDALATLGWPQTKRLGVDALRWVRKETDPFSFHDQAVWLARRNNTHVEIVNESEELSQAGGSACL
jgi:hypothetical protein